MISVPCSLLKYIRIESKDIKYGEGRLVTLTTQTSQFNLVKSKFFRQFRPISFPKSKFEPFLPQNFDIVHVFAVENDKLSEGYRTRKILIERGLDAPQKLNERHLYHGTKMDSIPKIISQGFLRQFAAEKSKYGLGCYFAVNPAYSANPKYSKPNADGLQFMFVCRVICGESCIGKDLMKVPGVKPGTSHIPFESAVDQLLRPSVYVTFCDNQAVPLYLIAFKNNTLKRKK